MKVTSVAVVEMMMMNRFFNPLLIDILNINTVVKIEIKTPVLKK